jgi:hypothetical protein
MTTRVQFRQFRAPRADRSALVDPPLGEAGGLVAGNVQLRKQWHYDFQGRSLAQLSRQARRELLREAHRWTSAYRDVEPLPAGSAELIFLAGHQPQLFHPGVWFKNFALGHLARRYEARAVNLLIDSDTIKSTALRVPGGSVDEPAVASVPMDRPGPPIPYEQRPILDRPLFADFGQRAAAEIAPWVADPLVRQYWPMVLQRARQTDNLGTCLAQARHQWEGRWGLETLEIPQSRVCQSESFAWFVAHLLAQLPRLREVYNQSIRTYRRAHRIRNTAHPVPELMADGPWLEAPFWIWRCSDPIRRALYVRRQGREIVLGDRQQFQITLPAGDEADLSRAVTRLLDLSCRGIKIRSRALITTLWARLVLGDLFVHGIGGAKYDQVTDLIMEQFFGLAPPGLMVISATIQLPIARPARRGDEPAEIQRRLRELTWHPEQLADAADRWSTAEADRLIALKNGWIHTPPTVENARRRFQEIRRINAALQPWVEGQRAALLAEQQQAIRLRRDDALLSSREYSFCLYPGESLREFFSGLLRGDGIDVRLPVSTPGNSVDSVRWD